jgi:lysophospholipid acyltransferase (LPLAT)-like uncharacterized protein
MGDFTNGVVSRIFATVLSFLVITINVYFVITYVISEPLVPLKKETGSVVFLWHRKIECLPSPR